MHNFFCVCYNAYRLVAVPLFATFALFCLQLLSIVLLYVSENKQLLPLLSLLVLLYIYKYIDISLYSLKHTNKC